ncbi:hypothetical protein PILCRDRAFT_825474 [Piloderma croceum F 1598]|uniref:Cytochrome P450 monooxygenase pc-3 n=1 Tax=Piloderma croceum (strain F 1598) TaxID=765440 RepID=A0A0C3FC28_PILCF|nr:hypothetical protein PILCRDRAFT_825474 [Piloderma croceum F 1598]
MALTPGLQMLLRNLPKLTIPPLLVYVLSHFLVDLSPVETIFAYILSIPCSQLILSKWHSWALRREMTRLGAQEMPKWEGKWPGSIDLLIELYGHWMNGYPCDGIDDATDALGLTFKTKIVGFDQVWTIDPRHVKSILATDFDGYAKGERLTNAMSTVLGNGIFNTDGDIWKFHRGITRPYFHRDRISDFALFAKHGDNAISQIKARMHEGLPVDFQDVMSRFTLDTATAFLLGFCVDSLSAGLPYPTSETNGSHVRHHSDAFARAFASAQHKMSARSWTGPSWQLFEMFGDATKSDNEIVDEFIGPILKDALAKKQKNEKSNIKLNPEEDTMLNSLLSQTDDYKLLRDETVNILIAGRDTTASLLTSAIYCLSQHPEVAEKLRKEIINKVGLARSPTYEDIKDMKYTRSVLNETLRLFPPVPFNVRETTRPTTWPPNNPGEKPYYLPSNSPICYSVWLMHRNKDFWGPDALEFDPDRFIDERLHKYVVPNPFIFLPFNAGPRLCLGQQFAYNEASFMLIRLFQTFDSVSLAREAQPAWSRPPAAWKEAAHDGKRKAKEEFWPKTHLTLYAHGGLWVTMKEAGSSEA